MNLRKIIMTIAIIFLINGIRKVSDLERYEKLKIENVASIKKSDLPDEFCDRAFRVVDEFIKKTVKLDYEVALFFDYITGEIVKCSFGLADNVAIHLDKNEYKGKHIASIHNHTPNLYSPPSDRNFHIFSKEFEDYEIIVSIYNMWILEAKGLHVNLTYEMKIMSGILFDKAYEKSIQKYENTDEINDSCDNLYGNLLSKYINDKNINNIELLKKEYSIK